MKTFTKHFSIVDEVEFFNIPLEKDLEVFICPFLIQNTKLESTISKEVYNRLVSFLSKLNRDFIKPNKRNLGITFLSHLHEPNEIHFGYSQTNKGKAVAKEKAATIFDSLRNNRFAKHEAEITNEAHNVLLLVAGIGQDIMSDTILNVCRDIFSEFTANQVKKYKLKGAKVFECEYYDCSAGKWSIKKYRLPTYDSQKVILVPRKIVSGNRAYTTMYNRFVASNYIAKDIINKKSKSKKEKGLFDEKTKKLIKQRIYKAYKKPKKDLIQFVEQYKGSLDEFTRYAKENYPEIDMNNLDY